MDRPLSDAESQDETIAFLADPKTHDGEAVHRIATHGSLVFIAGDRVYKLKRAVTYSYLDYATVEKREQACRRELALNRRIAPDLYLDARAIRRQADGRLGFDGDGAAIDWVVVMRRFDEEQLFERLADRDLLTPALMRELGDTLIAFHQASEATPEHGTRDSWSMLIRDTGRNLLANPGLDEQAVVQVIERLRQSYGRAAERIEARRHAGKVRRCHGDLHLRNVCLFENRVTLFDGIEFSDDIACIDGLYDLAFMLMDLHHRGLEGLGNVLFNRYLDRGDDADGLVCLPFFLSMRAMIRAHVSFASAQAQPDPAAKIREQHAAESYFTLAGTLLDTASPRLIAVGGLSGSGKSTLAARLASRFAPPPGARLLRSDVMRKRLCGVAPETKLNKDAYSPAMSDRVHRALLDEAQTILAAGYSVILDATYMDPAERDKVERLAEAAAVPFDGLWLEAAPETLRRRVAGRTGDASDADVAVLDSQLKADLGTLTWHRLDAGGGDTLDRAVAALR